MILNKTKKILLIRTDRLGDLVLTLPAIINIHKNFPNAQIDLIINKNFVDLVSNFSFINNLFLLNNTFISFANNLLKIRKNHYDLVIDLMPVSNHLHSLFIGCARSKIKVGYAVGLRKFFLTTKIQPANNLIYERDMVLRILERLNLTIFTKKTEFNVVENATLKNILDIKKDEIFIGIHPGVNNNEERRLWGVNNYAMLINELTKRKGVRIIITGGKNEEQLCNNLCNLVKQKDKVINMCGKTNLKELMYLLTNLKLYVCSLTGVTHLAVNLGIPTITLVGPTPIARWTSKDLPYIVIRKNLDCSPCEGYSKNCVRSRTEKFKCMAEISVNEVFKKIINLKNERSKIYCGEI